MSSLLNLPVLPRGFSLHVVLLAFILVIALLPIRVNGQERLRELKVTVMEKQQGLVVQASGKY
ncbi:MAG: hypothetical protein ACKORJ_13625, partial [Bacteroidota bacterium]